MGTDIEGLVESASGVVAAWRDEPGLEELATLAEKVAALAAALQPFLGERVPILK